MFPILLALTTAILLAVGVQLTKAGLRYTNPETATLVTIAVGAAWYWALAPFFVEVGYWLTRATLVFVVVGLFRPILTTNLAVTGTHHLGPTLSSTLAAVAPLFGFTLGVLVLGERPTPSIVAGTFTIVAGVAALSWRGSARFDWPWWSLCFPVAAAALRAVAHMLAKVGLGELPSPLYAGLCAYTVSLAVGLAYAARGGRRPRPRPSRRGFQILIASGTLYALSLLTLNTALERGQLIVVSPIIACTPLFSLLLGLFVFRQETLDRRVVAAVVLVVSGVVLVTLRM